MHELSRFYGIVIKLFFAGNPPAHFYALCDEEVGVFDLATLNMVEGDLSGLRQALVTEWAGQHREAILRMWQQERVLPLPPME